VQKWKKACPVPRDPWTTSFHVSTVFAVQMSARVRRPEFTHRTVQRRGGFGMKIKVPSNRIKITEEVCSFVHRHVDKESKS
jgi:hypothetical protein